MAMSDVRKSEGGDDVSDGGSGDVFSRFGTSLSQCFLRIVYPKFRIARFDLCKISENFGYK